MLKRNDFNGEVIDNIIDLLNKGYEVELKYPSDNLVVLKIKRKLICKIGDSKELTISVVDNLLTKLEDRGMKVELKKENDKTAIVAVSRVEMYRSKGL